MKRLKNYLWTDLKMMFRIPLSVFFSMIYPIVMMIAILASYGNIPIGDGYHLVDKYFMIAIGMGILPLTLISFPMWVGNSLENNSMERLYYFGVKISRMIFGDLLAHLVLATISMALNIIFAFTVFGLRFPPIWYFIAFILQYYFAVIVFMVIGAIFALVFKNTQILMPLGLVVMFLLYMLCGVFITYDDLPSAFKGIARYIPMKYAMNDFFDIWSSKIMWNIEFLILSALYIIVGAIIVLILIKCNKRISNKNQMKNKGGNDNE